VREAPKPDSESAARAVGVTLAVALVSAALIAAAVTVLAPYRERNRARQRDAHVEALLGGVPGLASLLAPSGPGRLEARVVELATGLAIEGADAGDFDALEAARDPSASTLLSNERDLAGIGRRANHAVVFTLREAGRLRLVILPVYGAGYASPLYGYLALDADLNTIRGLSFYEHGETPGLGSEIENPLWRDRWVGKWLRDAQGELRIEVVRGRAPTHGESARHQVDGITGATRTGAGVTNLLRFWLGPDGFGPYLARLQAERERR